VFWNKQLTNLCIKGPLHVQYPITNLGNLKSQVKPSTQYLCAHVNESLTGHKHDWQSFRQKSLNVRWFTRALHYTAHQGRSQMLTNGNDAWRMREQSKSSCYWTCCWWRGATVYILTFVLETNISSIHYVKMMWILTVDDFCQSWFWLFSDSFRCTCRYCVDDSVCDFNFPQVFLAHIQVSRHFCIVYLFIPGQVYRFYQSVTTLHNTFGYCYRKSICRLSVVFNVRAPSIG